MKQTEFKIGEHIVYPLQGVGIVKDIRDRTIHGAVSRCYVIYIPVSDMTVSVPVSNIEDIGIRAIVSKEDAKKALLSVSEKQEQQNIDWKVRYQKNVELVKEGSVFSIAKVVQALYQRSKIKELPVQERKLYDNVFKLMIDELSLALGKKTEEIEKAIFENLEK